MRKIIIQFDYTDDNAVSYVDVLKLIEEKAPVIFTNCLDFFNFNSLDKGYDVEVRKSNGDYIVLSELLKDVENSYSNRLIRKTHNVHKLLVANAFNFKKKRR